MKRIKIFRLSVLLLTIPFSGAFSQNYSETRKIERAFKYSEGKRIEIENKYGMVHVNTWNKDSVKFDISIKFNAKSEERLDKIISLVDFDFVNTQHYIVAKTELLTSGRTLLIDAIETLKGDNSEISIDYKVYLPQNCNLKLVNKYGDVFIGEIGGSIYLDVSYGDLRAFRINDNSEIKLSFGKGDIDQLENCKLDLNYSKIEIEKAKTIDVDSKYSDMELENINLLKGSFKQGEIDIEEIGTLDFSSSFTDFTLDNIKQQIVGDIRYGDIEIELDNSSIKDINLNSKYSNVKIVFNRSQGFNLSLSYLKTRLMYPSSVANVEHIEVDEKEGYSKMKGSIGIVSSESPNVIINSESGEVNFILK